MKQSGASNLLKLGKPRLLLVARNWQLDAHGQGDQETWQYQVHVLCTEMRRMGRRVSLLGGGGSIEPPKIGGGGFCEKGSIDRHR